MENLVLYRKYRPQTFGEIAGQSHVVKTLQNAIAQNKLAHAYLFCGPRGSGKTTIARLLAKSANCTSFKNEPCNKCSNCLDFNAGRSLDLIEIDAASNRGIDEIKNLRENIRFGPSTGRYKVYLIDEAHMLTKEAFNAFLKTLEEPPAHAIFVLATTEASRLLPTIVSRTQRFDFKRLSVNELATRLAGICQAEKVIAEPEALKFIATEADGSSRDAESMLGQIMATGESKITLAGTEQILGLFSQGQIKTMVEHLINKDQAASLSWLQQSLDSGYEVGQFLKTTNHYLRKMLMAGLSPDLAQLVEQDMPADDFKTLMHQTGRIKPIELTHWLKTLAEAKKNLEHYPLPQMAVEVAIINLMSNQPQVNPTTVVKSLVQNNISEPKVIPTLPAPVKELPKNEIVKLVEKIPVPKTSVSTATAGGDSETLILVQAKWPEIVEAVRPHNHSLFGFLQGMKLHQATTTSLTLKTKYSFHKERLAEVKNKKIIEDAVESVLGQRLGLICILDKQNV